MSENNTQQIQPEGSSKGRRAQRRPPRKDTTVFSVRKKGSVYEVRISTRFVKFGMVPVCSALLGLASRNASLDWVTETQAVQAAAPAAPAAQASTPPPVVRSELPEEPVAEVAEVEQEVPAPEPEALVSVQDERPSVPQGKPAKSGLSAAATDGKESARRRKEGRALAAG